VQVEEVARTLEGHRAHAPHAAGPRRHDDDSIRQRHRLGQVVRDEHDRLAGGVPEPQQLILQDEARLGVERPNGSSIRMTSGS
jgi:hypothetical protein